MRIDPSSTKLVLCPMVPSDPALAKLAVTVEWAGGHYGQSAVTC